MSVVPAPERRSISVYHPTTEYSSFECYSSLDAEQLNRALAGIEQAQTILRGVQQCLSTQSLRGRPFNLTYLVQARQIIEAHKYPIELVLEQGARAGGVA